MIERRDCGRDGAQVSLPIVCELCDGGVPLVEREPSDITHPTLTG